MFFSDLRSSLHIFTIRAFKSFIVLGTSSAVLSVIAQQTDDISYTHNTFLSTKKPNCQQYLSRIQESTF